MLVNQITPTLNKDDEKPSAKFVFKAAGNTFYDDLKKSLPNGKGPFDVAISTTGKIRSFNYFFNILSFSSEEQVYNL